VSTSEDERVTSVGRTQCVGGRRRRGGDQGCSSANAIESTAKFVGRSERCNVAEEPSYKNTV
jgi:hypothetical protein